MPIAVKTSNQGIAAAGGVGLGAAGSVALTLIGGGMSDNASATLTNDGGISGRRCRRESNQRP